MDCFYGDNLHSASEKLSDSFKFLLEENIDPTLDVSSSSENGVPLDSAVFGLLIGSVSKLISDVALKTIPGLRKPTGEGFKNLESTLGYLKSAIMELVAHELAAERLEKSLELLCKDE
jgi:hypothetical protein